MPLSLCKIITIPTITNSDNGSVSFFENNSDLDFDIKRIYYIHGVQSPEVARGMHAHKELRSIIIAVSGSFKVNLDDGKDQKEFSLSDPTQGLYLTKMIWRDLYDFSPGATALIIANQLYDENDYIRDYKDFLELTKGD